MSPGSGSRGEAGAVAVFVAVLSTLLLMMAALAVDLGNGWARKRAAQTQVDVSALSAGDLLPAQTAAAQAAAVAKVVSYMNRSNNELAGQDPVTYGQMVDGDLGNGEVIFSNAGVRMRVVAPPAHVNFTFGQLVADGVDVNAEATVDARSALPPGDEIFPFAMPDQCPFGPAMADTGPGGQNGPDTTGTFSPTNSRNGRLVSISPSSVAVDTPSQSVTIVFDTMPNNPSPAVIEFRVGANTVHTVTVPLQAATPATDGGTHKATFAVPVEVLENELSWSVWGFVKNQHTENNLTFRVGSGVPAPDTEVSCAASAEGQFGQMYSPRGNTAPDQQGFALNIALGLDHDLYPWQSASAPGTCGQKTQDPPSGGVQDKINPVGAPNCILPQTGNDGPWMIKGLITGIDSTPGRLNAAANGNTRAGCGANVNREGVMINNDKLSCFLKGSYTLNDIAQPTGVSEAMLDPAVVDSPRFVWIPVMHAQQRLDIDNNTFMAIKRFVPGFITDETRVASKVASDATTDNGIVIGGQLEALQVFMFNPEVLPLDLRSPTVAFDPTLGRATPVLVN